MSSSCVKLLDTDSRHNGTSTSRQWPGRVYNGCHSGTLVCIPSRGSRSCGARTFQLLCYTLTEVPVQACTKTPVFVFCVGCTKDRVEAAWRDRRVVMAVRACLRPHTTLLSRAGPSSARECMQHPRQHFYPQSGSPPPDCTQRWCVINK